MSESKVLYESETPKTQSIEAVKALLSFVGRGADPLPSEISLEDGRLMLILSNKKDVYYVTTAKACSCPSSLYRPGKSCKHMRKHFPVAQVAKPVMEEPGELIRQPFKPFLESDAGMMPAKVPSTSLPTEMLIDTYAPVTLPGEVRYCEQTTMV